MFSRDKVKHKCKAIIKCNNKYFRITPEYMYTLHRQAPSLQEGGDQWWINTSPWKVSRSHIIAATADNWTHTEVTAHCSSDVCTQERMKSTPWQRPGSPPSFWSSQGLPSEPPTRVPSLKTAAVGARQRDLDPHITCEPRCWSKARAGRSAKRTSAWSSRIRPEMDNPEADLVSVCQVFTQS